jgi:hypothetical protein
MAVFERHPPSPFPASHRLAVSFSQKGETGFLPETRFLTEEVLE